MQLNILISLLVHKGIIIEEEAKALVKELSQTIVPTEFTAAHRIVEGVLVSVEEKAENARNFIVSEEDKIAEETSKKKSTKK